MNEFEPGDRVQDVCWDGRCVGWVTSVEGSDVFVQWDGIEIEDCISPNQVRLIERKAAA